LINEAINGIKNSLPGFFVVNQEECYKKILRANNICFLDTCFITRLITLAEKFDIYKAFETMAQGRDEGHIVFVLTGLVLYELKDSRESKLQSKNLELFESMNTNGFTLVVIDEELVCENINNYLGKTKVEWNALLANRLIENKANLSKLFSVMANSGDELQEAIYDGRVKNNRDTSFIVNLIGSIKERKSDKDSLAEELVAVSLFFIMELIKDSNRNAVFFCSHDLPAIDRLNKVSKTSFDEMTVSIKAVSFFTFVNYMVEQGNITDKEALIEVLRKTMAPSIAVLSLEDSLVQNTFEKMAIEDVADKMLSGVRLAYVGKAGKARE